MKQPSSDATVIAALLGLPAAECKPPRSELPGPQECWWVIGSGHDRRWCRQPAAPNVSFCPTHSVAMSKTPRRGGR